MGLTRLGWNAGRDEQFAPYLAKGFIPARVAVEDKHFYRVWTADAEITAQVTGKFIHESRRDHSVLPKVGDWVAIKLVPNEEKAAIQAVLPRTTQITRKTSGRNTAAQILATNIETVFLVTAADPTFNTARLERMLVMGRESGARPVVLLNKIDLCDDLETKLAEATQAAGDALVLAVCALTGRGVKKFGCVNQARRHRCLHRHFRRRQIEPHQPALRRRLDADRGSAHAGLQRPAYNVMARDDYSAEGRRGH